jgi:hypothetical protein
MVNMIKRYLTPAIESLCFAKHKIAMISGPRQCGKTTFAKMLLESRRAGTYHNWDDVEFRRTWVRKPSTVVPRTEQDKVPIVVLDEIHKDRLWKRNLKGIYDTLTSPCDFLVTGSARLNVFRRGSDSLMGRFFHFRLHPFSIREMEQKGVMGPDGVIDSLFHRPPRLNHMVEKHLDSLMRFGPFPEPLFGRDEKSARLWRTTHEQTVIREDLRDISRLPDLGRLELMASLIPERVGSLFSLNSLREDMEISFDTLHRWLTYLKELYYLYEIKPYSRNITRSLRREGKVYLYDYSAVKEEPARFENLVASHLLKACHYWSDTGEGKFELFYLRDKEKREIDFLIVRDGVPWLPVEVKISETNPSENWSRFVAMLPCKRAVQLVRKPHWKVHKIKDAEILVAGAAEALHGIV